MNVSELCGKPVFRTCLFSSEKQSSQNDATFILFFQVLLPRLTKPAPRPQYSQPLISAKT